ncbi:MAG: hypothetical protein GF328_15000 [Candidatus Latescibacteria bacterium]|nr:hypothetical protein [Candidatus Latescibacterota bacterium]
MGIVVGYLVLLGLGFLFVLHKVREARREHLLSPVAPPEGDGGPPHSPVALRVVLALLAFFALVDLALVSFLVPPLIVALLGESTVALPGLDGLHLLLNVAFDVAVIRVVWSAWRYRRGWHVAGIVVSASGLCLAAWAWLSPSVSPARWAVEHMVVSRRGELLALGVLLLAWIVLGGWNLLRGAPERRPPPYRDEELASKTEPLEPRDRARVRWARGEASEAELENLT